MIKYCCTINLYAHIPGDSGYVNWTKQSGTDLEIPWPCGTLKSAIFRAAFSNRNERSLRREAGQAVDDSDQGAWLKPGEAWNYEGGFGYSSNEAHLSIFNKPRKS